MSLMKWCKWSLDNSICTSQKRSNHGKGSRGLCIRHYEWAKGLVKSGAQTWVSLGVDKGEESVTPDTFEDVYRRIAERAEMKARGTLRKRLIPVVKERSDERD